jgi:hypothetical protein
MERRSARADGRHGASEAVPSGELSEAKELVTSARQAAAVCGVTRFAVRAWINSGQLPEPPWTVQALQEVRDNIDPYLRRPGSRRLTAHGLARTWAVAVPAMYV